MKFLLYTGSRIVEKNLNFVIKNKITEYPVALTWIGENTPQSCRMHIDSLIIINLEISLECLNSN